MTISSLLIRIVLLLLPGLISWMLFRKLVGWVVRNKWQDLCEIIIFSVIIYSTYEIGVKIIVWRGWLDYSVTFFDAVLNEEAKILWGEIIVASLIGIPIGFIASYAHTHKFVNKVGRCLHVTRHFGDEDVWHFFHNLPEEVEYEWIYVRDHKANLIYFGYTHAYSDSDKEREMLLGDVDVYTNDTGEFLYKTKLLYLCRGKYDLTIEIPALSEEPEKVKQEKIKETFNV